MVSEYTGYQIVPYDPDAFPLIQQGTLPPGVELLPNEYLVVADGEAEVGCYRWTGATLAHMPYRQINSKFLGRVKARTSQQQLVIDMLYQPDVTIKVVTGKFGTGKDFLMCSAAIDQMERGKFEKIVWVRNNIEVKNSKPIGHLPGEYRDKLLPYAMPLADHLGGVEGLEMLCNQGKIEIVHLGFIRGRDIKKSIILCSECENMTKEHIQLLIGRVGEGSSLWLNGDFKQVDHQVFAENNGLLTAVEKLKGHPRFGYVKLIKSERSETAAMADLLD